MTFVTKAAPIVALAVLMNFVPSHAQAQDQRLRISFTPAAATVGGDAEMAWAGSVGYRFSEHFWFEGDFTWIDAAAGGFRDGRLGLDGRQMGGQNLTQMMRGSGMFWSSRPPTNIGGPGYITIPGFPNLPNLPNIPGLPGTPGSPGGIGPLNVSTSGSTMVTTLGVRYELPVQTERFRPYVAGGLGLNNTEQEFRLDRTQFTPAIDEGVSHTGYAVSAGLGASIRLFSQLSADVDAKYFRLSQERNVMRLGGGVSFRF